MVAASTAHTQAVGAAPQAPLVTIRRVLQATQGIQTPSNQIPLVGGRVTWVRAHVQATTTAPANLLGVLRLESGGRVRTLKHPARVSLPPPGVPGAEGGISIDFPLPADFTTPGQVVATLMGVVDLQSRRKVLCRGCGGLGTPLTFGPEVVLRVKAVGFRVPRGPSRSAWAPRPLDFERLESWLLRAYPVSRVLMDTVTVNLSTRRIVCGNVNEELARIRALDVDAGQDPRTRYYGLVADTVRPPQKPFMMGGCALAIPDVPDASVVASGPAGIPFTNDERFKWDLDGSYADFYGGHELGHTFGLRHPLACNQQGDELAPEPPDSGRVASSTLKADGFDPATREEYAGRTWHDMMTYCPRQWISGRSYERLLRRLRAEDIAYAPGSIGPAGDSLLQIVADLQNVDSGSVQRAWVHAVGTRGRPAAVDRTVLDTVSPGQRLVLSLMDEQSRPLATDTAWAMLDGAVPAPPGTWRSGVVNGFIRDVPEARWLCVSRGDQCLYRLPLHEYVLRRDVKADQERPSRSGGAASWRFSWPIAADGPVPELPTYYAQLSFDGGATWSTVAQSRKPEYELSCGAVPRRLVPRVRVIAYQGARRGQLFDTGDLFAPGENPCPPPQKASASPSGKVP
jgi:hypothetical protein